MKHIVNKRFFLVVIHLRQRSTFENAQNWIKIIRENAPKIHFIILVGIEPGHENSNVAITETMLFLNPPKKMSKKSLKGVQEVNSKEVKHFAKKNALLKYYELNLADKKKLRVLFYFFVNYAISTYTDKFYNIDKINLKDDETERKNIGGFKPKKPIDQLLKDLQLEDYNKNFQNAKVIFEDLPNLDDEDLEELIPDKIPRKRLLKYLEELKTEKPIDFPNPHVPHNPASRVTSNYKEKDKELERNFESEKWYIDKTMVEKKDIIGAGTFGVVKRGAYSFGFGKTDVAIKEITIAGDKQKNLVLHEIDIINRFDHPNVIRCYGAYYEDRTMNILMEYCEGGDLSDYKLNLISNKEKISCLLQIAKGINYIHMKNIVHRDLKPKNILVKHKIFKISDFGTTKHQDSVGNTFCGTLQYLAPEQLNNKSGVELDAKKIDVYSFGIIMWEVMTHKDAYGDLNKQENQLSKLIQIHQKKIRPDLKFVPLKEMKILIRECWNLDPEERPSFPELVDELSEILQNL